MPSAHAGPLLKAQRLRLALGGTAVLDDLSLEIGSGEVHALLGANGAGKSTLAYAIMGCAGYALQSGRIDLSGERIDGLPLHERARRGIALAWQEPARFEGLAVPGFLQAGAPGADARALLSAVGLDPAAYLARSLDKTLSGGERKRIELAGMLALAPRLAILDEPTAGIDLISMDEIIAVIDRIKASGASVLLITHHEAVAAHADAASQLCGGRIVCSGEPHRVIENFRARRCARCDGATCGYG
jgi:Fe-S cluster assembly ATP-binding protein